MGQAELAISWYVIEVMAQLSAATPWLFALLNSAYEELAAMVEKAGPEMLAVVHPLKLRVTGQVVKTGAELGSAITVTATLTVHPFASVIVYVLDPTNC